MAFLTKKEASLIRVIKSNTSLTADAKSKMISQINYNARLRQDGHRQPVREFIQAMATHTANTVLKSLNQSKI